MAIKRKSRRKTKGRKAKGRKTKARLDDAGVEAFEIANEIAKYETAAAELINDVQPIIAGRSTPALILAFGIILGREAKTQHIAVEELVEILRNAMNETKRGEHGNGEGGRSE